MQLTLTAGLDARAILAIALQSGVPFKTYTYGGNKGTAVDRAVAGELAEQFQLSHTVINTKPKYPGLVERMREANYMKHHDFWVGALMEYYEHPETVAVLGNTLEIGRSNTMRFRKYPERAPVSAETMANLHLRRMGPATRIMIDEYGLDAYKKKAYAAFESFVNETNYDLALEFLNPYDLFYWEHRMPTWQGQAMNEKDFYGESFIPFNARTIFETMLGVPQAERYEDATVYKMIESVDPSILDLPVNPKNWPQETS